MPKTSLVLSSPPVVETVLTIQFADLAGWQAVHHGLLFAKIRDKYPKYELHPMQQPIVESFPATNKMIRLQFSDKTDAGCANFIDNDETKQLRIQKNRFAFHWVKPQDQPYPHFRENVTNCRAAYQDFVEFCQEEKVGEPKPVLCEVVYVNHIHPDKDEPLAKLIDSIFGLTTGAFELGTFSRTYVLGNNEGRLYCEIETPFGEDGSNFVLLKMTSRVRHDSGNVFDTMGKAHDWLIEYFQRLTNRQARIDLWGSNENL